MYMHKYNSFFFFISTAKCIDSYTEKRVYKAENPDEEITIDPRLEAIVDRMFKRCFDDAKYKQVSNMHVHVQLYSVRNVLHEYCEGFYRYTIQNIMY